MFIVELLTSRIWDNQEDKANLTWRTWLDTTSTQEQV